MYYDEWSMISTDRMQRVLSPLTGGQHEEGVEEAAGEEEEHEGEGVQHAGPEVVVRGVGLGGV
jgi:hypothetical protein